MPYGLFNFEDAIESMGRTTRNPTSCPLGQKLTPYTATNAQGQVIERGQACLIDPNYKPTLPSSTKNTCPSMPATLTGGGYTYKLS